MTKSKLPEKFQIDAYNHRDVASLSPPLNKWTPEFEKVQKINNRMLQPGFMHRDATTVINDAKKAGVAWLTDICSPTAKADIMLHISKELVVNYQVGETELNTKAQEVYNSLVKNQSTLDEIEQKVDLLLQENVNEAQIEQNAREMLSKNIGPDKDITPEQLKAAKRIVLDVERRKMMDAIVSQMVKEHIKTNMPLLGLEQKTRYNIGETHDFFYGGPAGSGKSTLSAKDLYDGPDQGAEPKKINKKDCVTIATDIYRAFTLPGTDAHEAIVTKDVFTRTQDFAYLVKEHVLKELAMNMENDQMRPNLINDGVTVEWAVRAMLAQTKPENLVSKVALYRGDPGFVGIAERADARARKVDGDPADKGRFIETTSLFKGHADASQAFLSNLPDNAVTEVYDTNVDLTKNEEPVKVAIVNSESHTVEILNLRIMSEWLNKKNMNTMAEHPVELILKKQGSQQSGQLPLVTNPENKAAAIIDLVKGNPYERPPASYQVILKDSEGKAYASLEANSEKEVTLQVLDLDVFKQQVNREASPEADVLRAITRQTEKATAAAPTSPEAIAVATVALVDEYMDNAKNSRELEAQALASNAAEKTAEKEDARMQQEDPNTRLDYRKAMNDLRKSEPDDTSSLRPGFRRNDSG